MLRTYRSAARLTAAILIVLTGLAVSADAQVIARAALGAGYDVSGKDLTDVIAETVEAAAPGLLAEATREAQQQGLTGPAATAYIQAAVATKIAAVMARIITASGATADVARQATAQAVTLLNGKPSIFRLGLVGAVSAAGKQVVVAIDAASADNGTSATGATGSTNAGSRPAGPTTPVVVVYRG